MRFPRSSGILLHPTSLPGPYGVGDLGPQALRFADFLAEAGQTLWQVLPLGPTGYGDSPYQCFSALAGNPVLISPERLKEQGWLDESELGAAQRVSRRSSGLRARHTLEDRAARIGRAAILCACLVRRPAAIRFLLPGQRKLVG